MDSSLADDRGTVFDQLRRRLIDEHARCRIIDHPAEGNSQKVAALRGTLPGQGAKAMLCQIKELPGCFVLAVLSGDRKVDFRKLAQAAGGRKASLVSAEQATKLTGSVMGAVPPFSLWPNVRLIVDRLLLASGRIGAFKLAEPEFADWRLCGELTVGDGPDRAGGSEKASGR